MRVSGEGFEVSNDLRRRYRRTGPWYDLLDAPWERIYRPWRPRILAGLPGRVLEAGVGTGRNLAHHPAGRNVVAFDLSEAMLAVARERAEAGTARIALAQADAVRLPFADASFDSYVATFLYCVLPDAVQKRALAEAARVLRPGGVLRILEIVYSRRASIRLRQRLFAPAVRALYGAGFDRRTREHLADTRGVETISTVFLKDDTHLLLGGRRN